MRIVFFGTPEFAVPSLLALVGEGFDVAAVVTQPDKPQGRSRSRSVPPAVKVVADEEGLTTLQPDDPGQPDFAGAMRSLQPDIGVVVAYGHILKPAVLSVPRLGMINVHASLLPALRGAAPIQHAILQGLHETGISIMQMEEGMDSGPVLIQVPTAIAPDENAGELTVRLAELGALALIEGLMLIETGHAVFKPQDHSRATKAPKITRETARIRWTSSAPDIARTVRAMDPTPGAWSTLDRNPVKLFGPSVRAANEEVTPGQVIAVEPELVVAAGTGTVRFLDVQPAGSQRMTANDWVRGRGVSVGDRFE